MQPAISALASLNMEFPAGVMAWVELGLRWLHFLAGITWIGMLYFFNLVNVPLMKELDGATKGRVIPRLMPRALWWFRWGAVWTVFAGLLYFIIYLMRDAANAGEGASWGRWFGVWFLVWVVTWAVLYGLFLQKKGPLDDGRVLAAAVTVALAGASYAVLQLLSHPGISSKALSISVGGGMGLMMLLNVWGIIWRIQKKLIAWTAENAEKGTPMPAEAAAMARLAFKVSRANAWISIPMLFFMAAASHFPFLSGQ
jgi:uncharacterized membrane protein